MSEMIVSSLTRLTCRFGFEMLKKRLLSITNDLVDEDVSMTEALTSELPWTMLPATRAVLLDEQGRTSKAVLLIRKK